MKISTIFIATFLAWVAYDTNLFRRRGERYSSVGVSLDMAESLAETKREVRRERLQKPNVIPSWYKLESPKMRMKVNHFCSKSKDPRHSNQKKIRRMFNNL